MVADIEYRVFGPTIDGQRAIGERLRRALQEHPDVVHTRATMPPGEPKLFFAADEDAARLSGLSLAGVAGQLEANLEGGVSGSVIEDLERLPVRVRYADALRGRLEDVASIPLASSGTDRWIPASALGDFEARPELAGVTRFNRQRTNTIEAYVRDGALPIDVSRETLAGLEAEGWEPPPGYSIGRGGATEQDAEARANLASSAPLLGTLMVATLILVFRSVRIALMLGGVAGLSVGLALLSTWSMGFPISFNTILGTLGLIGVALNDSIVVVASIRADERARSGEIDAIVRAVMGCTRHVVATTLTTMGGFLPLLVFVGGEFWPSLAIVLVGGIAGASLVALLFIPGSYLLLMRPRAAMG